MSFLHKSFIYEVACTKSKLCHKKFKATNKNNLGFVVICTYIFPSFKHCLILKEVEFLPNYISYLLPSPVFFVGDMNIDLLKPYNSSSLHSNLMQCKGMMQLKSNATRITIDSAILIDLVLHNQFFDNLDCGLLHACLADNFAVFVKLPFSCKKYEDTGTTHKIFPFLFNENARQTFLDLPSTELRMPNLYDALDENFEMILESTEMSIKLCSYVKQCKNLVSHVVQ